MTERTKKRLLDLQAQQKKDVPMICPRCGLTTLKVPISTNALSRSADLYVCDACGTAEALLDYMKQSYPLYQWHAFSPDVPKSDFWELPATEVLAQVIQKQSNELARIYKLCRDDPDNAMEHRSEAFESCPGLGELWPDPFQAKYYAADGAVLIRYRSTEDGVVQMAANIIQK